MALCVSVAVDDIISRIDKPYDYVVPSRFADKIQAGMRAIVPFSRNNISKKALVLELFEKEDVSGLKELIDLFDSEVVVDYMRLKLVRLLKKRYFVTYYSALKTVVPRGVDFRIDEFYVPTVPLENVSEPLCTLFEKKRGRVRKSDVPTKLRTVFDRCVFEGILQKDVYGSSGGQCEKRLFLNIPKGDVERVMTELGPHSEKQRDLMAVFLDSDEMSEKDALYYSGCGKSTVSTLLKKGIIGVKKTPVEHDPYKDIPRAYDSTPIKLTDAQLAVYSEILNDMGGVTHLIHGVTGSGKTLVYMSLIDKVLSRGKSVIFMVPEISLTPQTLARFYSRYGDSVAVIHSGLAPAARADEWRRVRRGDARVVVGTRSAVFSPAENLGMIIIDEEHEPSYKSESAPRYHARDIAGFISRSAGVPLVLGSATPSVESRYRAQTGAYKYHRLDTRYNESPLPSVEMVDMRDALREGEQSFLSDRLKEAIGEVLEKKEQAILFLNRRGANTVVGCRSCGYVAKCPNCGVALTYHTANGRCMCHYCGYNIKMFDKCPECKSEHIKKLGVGTQLVYSELESMFPSARLLRMDFDTVSSYVSYGSSLTAFKNGDYDIMLGTQMVAKGLDFPNVTLVGVINADLSLYVDDYRANERTFSLLTQVCGRSGRAGKEGIAVIQTYSPDHEILNYAKKQDYDSYFDFEISFRKAMNYPPFCDLVRFTVTNGSEAQAYSDVSLLYKKVDGMSRAEFSDIPIRMLYPVVPRIARVNDRYRYSLIIKSRVCNRLYEMLNNLLEYFDKEISSELSVNVNPINNL